MAEFADLQATYDAAEPCPECGAKPGYDPATGVTITKGHFFGCSQYQDGP